MKVRVIEFDSVEDYILFLDKRKKMVIVCSDCKNKVRLNGIWMKISKDIVIALEVYGKAKYDLCYKCSSKAETYKQWRNSSWR